MGCGKSTIGPLLARRLGCAFVDIDREIESSTGKTIDEIFATQGESHFRGLEAELLEKTVGGAAAVIATGGGVMLSAANRHFLWRNGCTVWIDTPLPEIGRRLAAGAPRPLWRELDPESRRLLFERRRALYALARLRVATKSGDPEELAEQIYLQLSCGVRRANYLDS